MPSNQLYPGTRFFLFFFSLFTFLKGLYAGQYLKFEMFGSAWFGAEASHHNEAPWNKTAIKALSRHMIFSGLNIGNSILCCELTYFWIEFLKLRVWVYTSFMVFSFYLRLINCTCCRQNASLSRQQGRHKNVGKKTQQFYYWLIDS